MSPFSMLRSGRRNTRITLQPFKLYRNATQPPAPTPAGLHFLPQQLLYGLPPRSRRCTGGAAIGLLGGSSKSQSSSSVDHMLSRVIACLGLLFGTEYDQETASLSDRRNHPGQPSASGEGKGRQLMTMNLLHPSQFHCLSGYMKTI